LNWLEQNYDNIIEWAYNITKGDPLAPELAHYAIEQFLTHKRYVEIMDRHSEEPDKGHPRGFILAIMRNSWLGQKSEFSRYHKLHRADIGHRKRNIEPEVFNRLTDTLDEPYNEEQDHLLEAIEGILEELELDLDIGWYQARLFRMWVDQPNYSKLSRKTDIPRTSIANAVDAAKQHILQELKNRKII
jgi:hypothetical protein